MTDDPNKPSTTDALRAAAEADRLHRAFVKGAAEANRLRRAFVKQVEEDMGRPMPRCDCGAKGPTPESLHSDQCAALRFLREHQSVVIELEKQLKRL